MYKIDEQSILNCFPKVKVFCYANPKEPNQTKPNETKPTNSLNRQRKLCCQNVKQKAKNKNKNSSRNPKYFYWYAVRRVCVWNEKFPKTNKKN